MHDPFRVPLEAANANLNEICHEFNPILSYYGQFVSLVWWCLFYSPNSAELSNVLVLMNLLLSLPVSNGKLEIMFSQVENIKGKKRASLGNQTVSDLLKLSSHSTTHGLWWDGNSIRI